MFSDKSMDDLHIFRPQRSVSHGYYLCGPQAWRSVYQILDPRF